MPAQQWNTPADDDEPAPFRNLQLADEDCFAFDYWTKEAGFGVLEALALLEEGLSPSLHREFVRKHGCSARVALKILL